MTDSSWNASLWQLLWLLLLPDTFCWVAAAAFVRASASMGTSNTLCLWASAFLGHPGPVTTSASVADCLL